MKKSAPAPKLPLDNFIADATARLPNWTDHARDTITEVMRVFVIRTMFDRWVQTECIRTRGCRTERCTCHDKYEAPNPDAIATAIVEHNTGRAKPVFRLIEGGRHDDDTSSHAVVDEVMRRYIARLNRLEGRDDQRAPLELERSRPSDGRPRLKLVHHSELTDR